MDALDLTQRPPRSPRVPLAGLQLFMIARTVDKLRATLPGGNLGSYQVEGFSTHVLDRLGIATDALRDAVAQASSDDEIAQWVRSHSDPARYAEINAWLESRTIAERINDPEFVVKYPVVTRLSPQASRLDMLIADDEEAFPTN